MPTTYYAKLDGTDNSIVTGVSGTPQGIIFANLIDINGNSLPAGGFSSAPLVALKKLPTEKREATAVNITATGCDIYMVDYGYPFSVEGKYLIIIRG